MIAINSSILTAPWADFCIFGDSRWYVQHRPTLEKIPATFVSTSAVPFGPRVKQMQKIVPPPGLTRETDKLVMEKTTLQAAINLAGHLGVSEINVIGADMKPAPDGRTHHHPAHSWPLRPGDFQRQMDQLRMTVEALRQWRISLWNTSMESLIDFWPKRPLKDCLRG